MLTKVSHFTRHYLEMVVAMFLGMFVLGGAFALALAPVGIDVGDWRYDAPALMLLGMAFTMSVPMVAWMRHRGHGWAPAWEMTAAMFLPSVAAIGLLWADLVVEPGDLLLVQHAGMFPAMLAAMLLRLGEYTGHAGHAQTA